MELELVEWISATEYRGTDGRVNDPLLPPSVPTVDLPTGGAAGEILLVTQDSPRVMVWSSAIDGGTFF